MFHNSKVRVLTSNGLATDSRTKNPIMVEAGKKAALTRASATYTFDERLIGKHKDTIELASVVREYILGIDESIEEVPKKYYIAYKVSQNIVCIEIQSRSIKLFIKLNAIDIPEDTVNYRDVSKIGHYGTGNSEFNITSQEEFEPVKEFILKAYNKIGG